jgi:phosphoglycolate phosphatase
VSAPVSPILLVDMDGTLVDTQRDLAVSINHTLCKMGHPPRDESEIRAFVGRGATTLLKLALASEQPAQIESARQIFFDHYEGHLLDHTRLFEGWQKVLDSDVRLVCATNKPQRFAARILNGLGLSSRFELLVAGDTLPVSKPDVRVARHIAEALGVAVDSFVMVGDGTPDGKLAQNCAFPFWAARWGYAAEDELAPFDPLWLAQPQDILEELARA